MYRNQILPLLKACVARSLSLNKRVYEVSEEVKSALSEVKPVVALESTIITHGMPFPQNIECALQVEDIIRSQGSVPATIALIGGTIKVGLSKADIEYLGDTKISKPVKTSRRDFPYVMAKGLNGGTTVSGTIIVCKEFGIPIFATGGIGGVHRGASDTFDISSDLTELGRSNVAVVSSGVKSILDISKTLEYLETQGVFVATLGSTNEFPAFYSRSSGYQSPYCLKNCSEAANIIEAHKILGSQSGLLFAVPVPEKYSLNPVTIERIIEESLEKANKAGIRGKEVTPFLLSEIARISLGKSLETNVAIIKNNAKVAAEISVHLFQMRKGAALSSESREEVSDRRPVIIGGCNLDCVAHLDADNIKLDGRIHMGRFDYSSGGVGRNICEALGKLGCQSYFISAIGDDPQGRMLMEQIPEKSSRYVAKLVGHNSAQCIIVLDKQGNCSFLMGDMHIHSKISVKMIEQCEGIIKESPLMIMDGNISHEAMAKALEIAVQYQVPVFYEPTDITVSHKPFATPNWKSIKFITPNLGELKHIASYFEIKTNSTSSCELELASEVAQYLAHYIENVIVTLGSKGILIARKGEATDPLLKNIRADRVSVRHYPVEEKNNFVNVSGAGDCFASGFIVALLHNCPENQCVSVGFAAANEALYSRSSIPENMFDRHHISWSQKSNFVTLR